MTLFNPSSIAVIGASNKKHKVGYQVMKNLLKYKKVFPVNLKEEKILGKKVYKNILNIKEKIELAVIVIPAKFVPETLEQCGKKKIKYAIIISAGFKEAGNEKLERQVKLIANKHNIRIIGPNCFGVINTDNNLNTTFSDQEIKKGSISLITQSGALCAAILDYSRIRNIGYSKFVSLGNKSDIDEVYTLKLLEKDKSTNSILIYTEGINNGKEFFKTLKKLSKPIIALKAGDTKEAKKSISTHTGSIAGSEEAYKTAFEQAGVIEAETIEELLNYAKAFSLNPLPTTNNIAIISNAGGLAVLAADSASKEKVKLANLSKDKKLKRIIPKHATTNNPLDIIGDAKSDLYEKTLSYLIRKKNIGGILVILTPQAMTEVKKTAQTIVKLKLKHKKPIFTSFVGGYKIEKGIEILEKAQIPNFFNPSDAIKCFSAMNRYKKYRRKKETFPKISTRKNEALKLLENTTILSFEDKIKLLKLYSIPYVKHKIIKTRKDLNNLKLSYPLVLKTTDPKITHKTEIGGIIKDIRNKKQLLTAYDKIKKISKNIVVQEFKEGIQLIMGSKTDSQFGPIILFGSGGIYTEILKDVSFSIPPISNQRADEMIRHTKIYKILKGARTGEPADLNKLKDTIIKLSKMVEELPIKELDFNPLIIKKDKLNVVDLKIKLK